MVKIVLVQAVKVTLMMTIMLGNNKGGLGRSTQFFNATFMVITK